MQIHHFNSCFAGKYRLSRSLAPELFGIGTRFCRLRPRILRQKTMSVDLKLTQACRTLFQVYPTLTQVYAILTQMYLTLTRVCLTLTHMYPTRTQACRTLARVGRRAPPPPASVHPAPNINISLHCSFM